MQKKFEFDEDYDFGTPEVWVDDENRETSIIVLLSPQQYDIIELAADEDGYTVEEFIRQAMPFVMKKSWANKGDFDDGARERNILERKEEHANRNRPEAFNELKDEYNKHYSKLVKVPVSHRARAEYEWAKKRYQFNIYTEFQMALHGIRQRLFCSHRRLMNDWHDNSL